MSAEYIPLDYYPSLRETFLLALPRLSASFLELSQISAKEFIEYSCTKQELEQLNKIIKSSVILAFNAQEIATSTKSSASLLLQLQENRYRDQLSQIIQHHIPLFIGQTKNIIIELGQIQTLIKHTTDKKKNRLSYFIWKLRFPLVGLIIAAGLAVTFIGIPASIELAGVAAASIITAGKSLYEVCDAIKNADGLKDELKKIADDIQELQEHGMHLLEYGNLLINKSGAVVTNQSTPQANAALSQQEKDVLTQIMVDADRMKEIAQDLIRNATKVPAFDKANASWCTIM